MAATASLQGEPKVLPPVYSPSPLPFLLFVLTLSVQAKGLHGQDTEPRYLSAVLEPTSKKNASFYRVPNGTKADLFVGTTFSLDGRMKAEGTYDDDALTIEHGSFVFYHQNGNIESKGAYEHGLKSGVWKRFDPSGDALAEKIYDPEPLANIIYTRAQLMPRYSEGDERELVRYIKDRVNAEAGKRTKAKVTASFVVEKSGALSDVKVIGGKDAQVDKQVADAILSTAPWAPGMEKGQPVRVNVRIPVQF